MENIIKIIERKEKGIDCTKDESVLIKSVVKHIFELISTTEPLMDYDMLCKINLLFPIEYREGLDEFNKIINEVK
jgi:hypothetical protein